MKSFGPKEAEKPEAKVWLSDGLLLLKNKTIYVSLSLRIIVVI